MKNTKYTKNMHHYLAWRLFQEVYGEVEWCQEEEKIIAGLAEEASWKLTDEETQIVENRVRRMKNEYEKLITENLREEYGDDDGDDDFFFAPIDYNEKFYEIWKQGVAKRQTVKIKYDSTESGITERLVNPYKSRAPYGEGYCHNRQEVRKFRFDRVIDIKLTEKKFKKPKVM